MDFSPASEHAFETALDLIAPDGHIILMHVIGHSFADGHIPRGSLSAARKKLRAFANSARFPDGHHIKLLVRAGTPFHEILAAAKDHDVGLIVLGIDESDPFDGLALGRTADRISRYASCSVLLVRSGTGYAKRAGSLAVGQSSPAALHQ